MTHLRTNDNTVMPVIEEDDLLNLKEISSYSIEKLCENNPSLLIFPQSLSDYKKDFGKSYICNTSGSELITRNVMGFVGRYETKLYISSRFYSGKDDYFLHYMLQKVFSINIFDMNVTPDEDNVWNFLLYLFPYFLNKALTQGVYKEYKRKDYNDLKIKGAIDFQRHIKTNIPFQGKVAYTIREYDYDNNITQLIRHTIEFVRNHPMCGNILENSKETKGNVDSIVLATPSYEKRDRNKIINKNLRPKHHPYFYKYTDLQKLCLQILRYEKINFGEKKENEIYGLMFDGSWLWEEYLDTILKDYDFIHPENINRTNPIYLFENNKGFRYPDFYNNKDKIVLDAKYKRYESNDYDNQYREDLHQIITYMYALKYQIGGFLIPREEYKSAHEDLGRLNGYGGNIHIFPFSIPMNINNFPDFTKRMMESEDRLVEDITRVREYCSQVEENYL